MLEELAADELGSASGSASAVPESVPSSSSPPATEMDESRGYTDDAFDSIADEVPDDARPHSLSASPVKLQRAPPRTSADEQTLAELTRRSEQLSRERRRLEIQAKRAEIAQMEAEIAQLSSGAAARNSSSVRGAQSRHATPSAKAS